MDDLQTLKRQIKTRYRNGPDNIGAEFVAPCLKNAELYRRGTGFFSSGALIAYANSMDHMIQGRTKIQIICSPVVSDKTLLNVLSENITDEQRKFTLKKLSNQIVLTALGYQNNNNAREYKRDLLAYFIAKKIIEIKFAIPKDFKDIDADVNENSSHLYHVKTGYFKLFDGSVIGFDGSFNESDAGHHYHIDQTQVWRSWDEADSARLTDIIDIVDSDWNGTNPYIDIFDIDEEALELARKLSPSSRPNRSDYHRNESKVYKTPDIPEQELRDYQKDALLAWSKAGCRGILAMATGTGKTRTAIYAIREFSNQFKNGVVVITVPYRVLGHQWIAELRNAGFSPIKVFESSDTWYGMVQNIFFSNPSAASNNLKPTVLVCVNKTFEDDAFQSLLKILADKSREKMIIVDEVHHFNNQKSTNCLPTDFKYRLGLSATPYEPDDERILDKYFDDIVYRFDICEAISKGVLCRYYYKPLLIEFTGEEASQFIAITSNVKTQNQNSKIQKSGIVHEQEVDRLLESVTAKLVKLREHIQTCGVEPLSLFYCGEGSVNSPDGERHRQIHLVTQLLSQMRWRVGKITSEESGEVRNATLNAFKQKQLDAIASIRVLDEGMDIPDCRVAYILASQRSLRQAIQRRGRILRLSENKEFAILYDFIIVGPKLSNAELDKLYNRELERATMFAKDAVNKDECFKTLSII